MGKTLEKIDSTMEDVLASIKQIISEDLGKENKKAQKYESLKVSKKQSFDDSIDEDIIELTEEIEQNSNNVVSFNGKEIKMPEKDTKTKASKEITPDTTIDLIDEAEEIEAPSNDDFVEPTKEPKSDIRSKVEEQVESLISEDVMKVSADALKGLDSYTTNMKASIQDNSFGQKTVEDLMKEMLRPLLKEWLDANLPSLVKWLVTEQIEKMLKNQKS